MAHPQRQARARAPASLSLSDAGDLAWELRARLAQRSARDARIAQAESDLIEVRALLRVAYADDLACLPREEAAAIRADAVLLAEHAVRRTRPGNRAALEAILGEARS